MKRNRTTQRILSGVWLWACFPFLFVGAVADQDPVSFEETGVTRPDTNLVNGAEMGGVGLLVCETDSDCDDGNACTVDVCLEGLCSNTAISDCVPCEPSYNCPPVEIVFIMDTSGSMGDEAAALCAAVDHIVAGLKGEDVVVYPTMLGITEIPGGEFFCLTDDVVSLYGDEVPNGPTTCVFPDGPSAFESWGPGTAIVADRFDWSVGATHIIVPISDEGPCNGNRPDGCNDPGDDRDSIENAILAAADNSVIVSPVTGTGSNECVKTLADALAAGTGGTAFHTEDAGADLPGAIVAIILESCELDDRCDDGNFCTHDDACVNGVCEGVPVPGCVPCTPSGFCSDGNGCTDDECNIDMECITTPNFDDSVYCCDPETGDVTPLDDGNMCTTSLCDPETGEVSQIPVDDGTLCDDGLFCRDGETCAGGVCGGGSPHDCTALDDQCNVGVCNDTTDTCEALRLPNGEPCNDGLFCTDGEACESGVCVGSPLDCSALDGVCVVGVCDEAQDACVPEPLPEGSACDDGDVCTVWDQCDGRGACVGTVVNSLECTTSADCPQSIGAYCNESTGTCVCVDLPELCLEAVPGDGCYTAGDEFAVNIQLGHTNRPIVGGQFLIRYDPTLLEIVHVTPGHYRDADSPFGFEIFMDIDPSEGSVFYAVGTEFSHPGTQGPALMATMWFRPLVPCTTIPSMCFVNENLKRTLLTDATGWSVPYMPDCCTGEFTVGSEGPVLSCPDSVSVNADAGGVTASVTWYPVGPGEQVCDDAVMTCSAVNSFGADIDHLVEAGGLFPTGHSEFECVVTSACGVMESCTWSVDVSRTSLFEVSLQLSPTIVADSLRRCVEFEFFSNCVEAPLVIEETIQFGLPYYLPGHADQVVLKIPPGRYTCVAARDPLHTLRSAAAMEIVDGRYVAVFEGDPFFGGNWLVGGNLDGSHTIDIVDSEICNSQFGLVLDVDTPCGTVGPHADINGNGIVNELDAAIIEANHATQDTDTCCPEVAGSRESSPVMELTIRDLERMGLDHLKRADTNGDGVLDAGELTAWFNSRRSSAKSDRARNRSRR